MNKMVVKHIGLIPDGARRWARREGVSLEKSYKLSMEKISIFAEHLFFEEITSVSIYLASTFNLEKRTDDELRSLFSAFNYLFSDLMPSLCERYGAQACVAGSKTSFIYETALTALIRTTKCYKNRSIYLLINYNPLSELRQVDMNRTDLDFWESFWVPERLDLVFRTGGARVLSDFLPLQSGYAQLVFLDELFNDLPYSLIHQELNRVRSLSPKYGE
jgi:undecaprenyl diphosphate synthase